MAKKKYDSSEGVWRTIGGRRVFIKTGQSLSDAMKESGKFKKKDEEENEASKYYSKLSQYQAREDLDMRKAWLDDNVYDENKRKEYEDFYKQGEEYYNKKYGKHVESGTNSYKGHQLSDSQKQEGIRLNQKAENGVRGDIKDFLSGKEDYDGSREDFINDLSNEWGVERSKVENILNEERIKHPRNFKTDRPNRPIHQLGQLNETDEEINLDEKSNWREQVKRNNELMERELEDYKKNHDISRESDGYYEIFRNNERRNAKIKQEVPTEPYEYVEAYAGYHDKSYKLAGTKMSGKDVVEYGTKSWTGKEYTNDEFMEHLTDSNWHQERKMLEEAKLTNQELAYIKDRTTLSQWSVGEELTGSKNVEKMIKEAKNHFASSSSNLMNRYTGTVDYLKQTTNMSGAEILELLKRIDEDKK